MGTAWRHRVYVMIATAAVVAAAVAPAAAGEFESKSWEVGASIVSVTYDNDSTIADTFAWSVRGGYILSPRHEFELALQSQSADDDATEGSGITYDITKWDVSYLYNLKTKKPDSKFICPLIFGIGQMSYDNGDLSDSTTTFRGGAGIRYFFTKRFALRFEGIIWHFHGDGTMIPRDGWFSFDTMVGVSYVFGGGA